MEVAENLLPTHSEKVLKALKAERKINRITFKKSEAGPGDTLYVTVPKLNKNEVLVPGSLSLIFEIDLSGGHANNFLVQNVTRALVDKMFVRFGGTTLQDTDGYDIYKTFEDLFLSQEKRDGMILEGIQSEDLCKIRSGSGDKKTSGVDAENKLGEIFGKNYRIRLDHQILDDHGVFYPQSLFNDLTFELKLAPASQVVRGSDPTKLRYKLIKIQLEYEMIQSVVLAEKALSAYMAKEFAYDHVQLMKKEPFSKGSDTLINIKVDAQRRSLKAVVLLFKDGFNPGARDSEKYIFPDLTKVKVTVNGKPSMLYNEGIEGKDMWEEAKRFFVKQENKTQHMNLTKFYTGDRFGLVIDLRSMREQAMHGSGTELVNSTDGVFIEINREAKGSGNANCHVFAVSDSQFNIQERQLESVQN